MSLTGSLAYILNSHYRASECLKILREVFSESGIEDSFITVKEPHRTPEEMAAWRTIKDVLTDDWFHRAWIVEELGVLKAGVFIYGLEEVSKDTMLSFITIFNVFAPGVCHHFGTLEDVGQVYNMMTLYTMSHIKLSMDSYHATVRKKITVECDLSVLHILNRARDSGRRATLSADHLYAFLGHPRAVLDGKPLINIDYTLPIDQVFMEFAKVCLNGGDGLAILSYVYHGDKEDPS